MFLKQNFPAEARNDYSMPVYLKHFSYQMTERSP